MLNYSDDGEDGIKDFFVGSKEVLGDGSVEAFNGMEWDALIWSENN